MFQIEKLAKDGLVRCYTRNDRLEFNIPYELYGNPRVYEPDFIVKLTNGVNVVVEVKGIQDPDAGAKLLERRHPPDRARKLITYIMGSFVRIEIVSESAPIPPTDPDDEIFLICALDGDADFLVSEDRDLLDLKASYPRPVIGRCAEIVNALGI